VSAPEEPVDLAALLAQARATGDSTVLLRAIPYARFLGLEMMREAGTPLGVLRFGEHLVGDATIPALHGGTLAALLESTAIMAVMIDPATTTMPRTITITIDYLRSGRAMDTFCRPRIVRQGRRVAVVAVEAYQDDRDKPVATAVVHLLVAD
jgi:uncharacterized protein (TIGR00369 family)